MVITNRVRELREAKGWDRVALSYHSKVGMETIARIESGDGYTPSLKNAVALAQVLEVPVDELFRVAEVA